MATILIVDDEAATREPLVSVLAGSRYHLIEADDGAEALLRTRGQPPDLVIADILLPTMDGYEFVRRLRADKASASTPIIFSAPYYLEREARGLAAQCGVRFVLIQPADPETVLKTVAAALRAEADPADDCGEQLQAAEDSLSRKVAELEAVNGRLQALVELSERCASERDAQRLLEAVARSARAVVGARHALVGIPDAGGGGWLHFLASGIAPEVAAQLTPRPGADGMLGSLLDRQTCVQAAAPALAATATGLPDAYPPISALLAVRVASPLRTYGWLCLTDKLGAPEFSPADARLAAAIGSLAGRVYENGNLYQDLTRSAATMRALNADLEARVTRRTAQLDSAMRELESFSYSVSHDLRSPLRHIEGFTALLLDEHADQLDAAGQQYLARIAAGTRHMGQLIDDLLALARVARHPMTRKPVSLSALAEAVAVELRAGAPTRQVELRIAPGLVATGDAHLLRIALDNLLENSWKYTSKRPLAHIELGARSEAGETVYFVRDNGAGFDPAYADRLFVAFQRLHSESEFEGTGIGLATVQRIIARHGGRIWGEGAPDHGATFYFTLAGGQEPPA